VQILLPIQRIPLTTQRNRLAQIVRQIRVKLEMFRVTAATACQDELCAIAPTLVKPASLEGCCIDRLASPTVAFWMRGKLSPVTKSANPSAIKPELIQSGYQSQPTHRYLIEQNPTFKTTTHGESANEVVNSRSIDQPCRTMRRS